MKQLRRKSAIRALHRETALREVELAILMQDWDDGYNVGGMFRVADACGASLLVASGKTDLEDPRVGVTSMGAHRRIPARHFARHDEAIAWLRAEGFALVAVEIADRAQDFRAYPYSERTCLVLGAEGSGLRPNVLKACDAAVYVPMAGKGRSLNVHVAAAVVAFEVMLEPPDA